MPACIGSETNCSRRQHVCHHGIFRTPYVTTTGFATQSSPSHYSSQTKLKEELPKPTSSPQTHQAGTARLKSVCDMWNNLELESACDGEDVDLHAAGHGC